MDEQNSHTICDLSNHTIFRSVDAVRNVLNVTHEGNAAIGRLRSRVIVFAVHGAHSAARDMQLSMFDQLDNIRHGLSCPTHIDTGDKNEWNYKANDWIRRRVEILI
jgi:hypothetical protein